MYLDDTLRMPCSGTEADESSKKRRIVYQKQVVLEQSAEFWPWMVNRLRTYDPVAAIYHSGIHALATHANFAAGDRWWGWTTAVSLALTLGHAYTSAQHASFFAKHRTLICNVRRALVSIIIINTYPRPRAAVDGVLGVLRSLGGSTGIAPAVIVVFLIRQHWLTSLAWSTFLTGGLMYTTTEAVCREIAQAGPDGEVVVRRTATLLQQFACVTTGTSFPARALAAASTHELCKPVLNSMQVLVIMGAANGVLYVLEMRAMQGFRAQQTATQTGRSSTPSVPVSAAGTIRSCAVVVYQFFLFCVFPVSAWMYGIYKQPLSETE